MIEWIVENSLGMLPVVMERHMHQYLSQSISYSGNTSALHRNCQNECSVTYIQAIYAKSSVIHPASKFIVRGYQWNRGITTRICFETALSHNQIYSTLDTNASKITHFTCFDTTVIYMLMVTPEAPLRTFYCCFNGCNLLKSQHIRIYELVLFQDTYLYQLEDCTSYEFVMKHINTKSRHSSQRNIHYNWTGINAQDHIKPEECIVQSSLDGLKYTVHGCCCVFCFKRFQNIASLAFHINHIHSGYQCAIDNESSVLTKTIVHITEESNVQVQNTKLHKNIFYVSKNYKRYRKQWKQSIDLDTLKNISSNICEHSQSTLSHLLCKNINLTQNQDLNNLMTKWNTLRIHQNAIIQDMEFMINHEKDNPEIINFLIALYHKSIINPDELVRLLYLLFQNKSSIQ
ncbi:hypothetical protein CWI42_011120 [Ordospora colligata]|uniref:C2H2-type domain-containing protein n=1 Tax=Ordospora colligata OC4 TaxID=1354746 RepID=A0A0B2UM72_9MICR|nr:uncharacterized protein M896_011120 [Ordospora colligata OC4]KHN70458.1 hypothetical protein M896_011120 [Ordospora colligata OC4]TBU17208.1 hypothetical protein CWI41_011120 [Ordospora colligata]TBU17458.1 hypothetical protein CWI40_011120 [Ordospora colligata]TBU19638.1 hypothetical protein CWI42_011120 [Ordospora colligata]